MKNIALGQYYPTGSVIHRADPRMKLILAVLFIVCTFLCKNIYSFGAILLASVLLVLVSRIPLKTVLRSIRALLFIMIFTLVINVFMTKGEVLLFEWKFIHIYREGIVNACFMLVRIFALIIGTSILLTYTTTPIALTDAIESLLSPLKKIKLPIHEFAMMMTIALRFIPTLMEETEKIMAAQKKIWDKKAKSMLGAELPALVVSPGVARLESQAPDVDGVVRLDADDAAIAPVGEFVLVRLVEVSDYDFIGELV